MWKFTHWIWNSMDDGQCCSRCTKNVRSQMWAPHWCVPAHWHVGKPQVFWMSNYNHDNLSSLWWLSAVEPCFFLSYIPDYTCDMNSLSLSLSLSPQPFLHRVVNRNRDGQKKWHWEYRPVVFGWIEGDTAGRSYWRRSYGDAWNFPQQNGTLTQAPESCCDAVTGPRKLLWIVNSADRTFLIRRRRKAPWLSRPPKVTSDKGSEEGN